MKCPICESQHHSFLTKTLHFQEREFHKCHDCDFIFVPKKFHLNSIAEKTRYDQHNNEENDKVYHNYLLGLLSPLLKILNGEEKTHLDFGCGRAQVLKHILNQDKIISSFYDLYFYPDKECLEKKYDVVTCIEVVEHFNDPLEDMIKLVSLANNKGLIFLNTQLFNDALNFEKWWYKNDPTHISIFSLKTLEYLENKLNLDRIFCDEVKTVIWRKK